MIKSKTSIINIINVTVNATLTVIVTITFTVIMTVIMTVKSEEKLSFCPRGLGKIANTSLRKNEH
jgi:hypothetical protein